MWSFPDNPCPVACFLQAPDQVGRVIAIQPEPPRCQPDLAVLMRVEPGEERCAGLAATGLRDVRVVEPDAVSGERVKEGSPGEGIAGTTPVPARCPPRRSGECSAVPLPAVRSHSLAEGQVPGPSRSRRIGLSSPNSLEASGFERVRNGARHASVEWSFGNSWFGAHAASAVGRVVPVAGWKRRPAPALRTWMARSEPRFAAIEIAKRRAACQGELLPATVGLNVQLGALDRHVCAVESQQDIADSVDMCRM